MDVPRFPLDGLEVTRKASGAPEVIGFDCVNQWKVNEVVFKLGLDDSHRPTLAEETSQSNFYLGLLLFCRLCDAPSSRSTLGDEAHVTIS